MPPAAPVPAPAPPAPGARDELLRLAGEGRVLDVDADGLEGEGFDVVISAARIASHPRPRAVAAALAKAVRRGGLIAFAAPDGSPWARYETAYRHFYGFDDFDVLERDGYVIVFARRP